MRAKRREFLRQCMRAAGVMGLYAGGDLGLTEALAQQNTFSDYKALVCVFLFGGNDSFNNVVPRSDTEYQVYAQSRQNLAVLQGTLLPITAANPDGALYGMHPALLELKTLFDAGRMAIVANVGNLIEPVTKAQYQDGSVTLPAQLFSHSDQQLQWQALLPPRQAATTGWGGRMAAVLSAQGSRLPLNLTLSGTNPWQVGADALPYDLGVNGAIRHQGLNVNNAQEARRREVFLSLLNKQHTHALEQAYADVQNRALNLAADINVALDGLPELTTVFPDNNVAARLRTIARMIAARAEFGNSRQIFFVGMGGYDTHDDQLERQPELLATLAPSLAAFYQATVELGVAANVSTFTMSEFGRTLTSNGDGTDHGWGGHQFVIGDAVLGQDIYGVMPSLAIDGPDDARDGRIIPTTSVDEFGATLTRWFGLSEAQIDAVFPNLANFNNRDSGFMGV